MMYIQNNGGRVSSVGIATRYRAGRSGDRIPVGGRFLTDVSGQPIGSRLQGAKILHPEDGIILAPEDVTDTMSRNDGKKLPLLAA